MAKTAVIGGSGYTGAELLRLLARHPQIEMVQVTASSNAGSPVTDLYPSLAPAYEGVTFQSFDPDSLADGLDLVFVALPHGESQRHMSTLTEQVPHVVDIGADFRLPADVYAHWYGAGHEAPELIDEFAFGLPELFRDEISSASHVANPGCYPTAAILALAPVIAEGIVEPTGLVVDAISGISGRGRSLTAPSLFAEANEAVAAYGLLDHRHTAEMETALSKVGATTAQVLFTPHVAPMTRGILATCYGRPAADGLSTDSLLDAYRQFYAGERFIRVADEPAPTKATLAANTVVITPRYDDRTDTVLVVAVEDNLVKGAAGQAIQNANLLLGLDESLGLETIGIMP